MATNLVINILANASDAKKALADTSKSVDDVGQSSSNMGKVIAAGAAAGLAGLVALGVGAFNAAQESAKIGRETERVLRTTGSAAWESVAGVQALAGAISDKTGVDDEAIQSGANLLLTFTNIQNKVGEGNDVFDRATAAALDMSVALGSEMSGAAVQLGKALNDPIKGVTALSKAGVSFNEGQKEQIRLMVEAGDLLGAQKIVLNEVEKEFKGAAEAAGTPFDKLKVAIGNLQEDIGANLIGPASAFATVLLEDMNPALESTISFLQSNTGALKLLASGGLAIATLALGQFVAAQAVALGTGFASFISEIGVAYAFYTEGTLAAAAATGLFDSALITTLATAGPLLIPLLALTGAIFAVMNIMDKSSESADKFWDSLHRDVDVTNLGEVAAATQKVTDRQIELTRAQSQAGFGDLAAQAADLLIPFHDVENSLTDQQKEHDALATKQKEHADATAIGTEKLRLYADATAGVNDANRTSIPFWEDSTKLMSDAEGAASGINDKLLQIAQSKKIDLAEPGAADRVQALYERTQATSDATLTMTDSQKKFNDVASDAKDKVDAYKGSLDALIGVHLSAAAAETAYASSSLSTIKVLQANGAAAKGITDASKASTLEQSAAIVANDKAIQDNVKSIVDLANATFRETNDLGVATNAMNDHRASLVEVMKQFGFTEDQANEYLNRLGLTPANINTQVNLDNHQAVGAIGAVKQGYQDVEKGAKGVIKIDVVAGKLTSSITAIEHMAAGGPVAAGRTFLVGEEGPELFTPGVSGRIHPNGLSPVGTGNIFVTINHTGLGVDSPKLQRDLVETLRRYQVRNGRTPIGTP
jgi:hypothetical protein